MGSGSGWRLTTRGKARSGWLLALSAVAALPVAALLALAGLPAWVQVLTVAAGALIGLVVDELRTGRSQRATAVASLRAQVAGAPDRLPLVEDVDVATARVHPALHEVGYIARAVERDVAEALAARRKVLIAGTPMYVTAEAEAFVKWHTGRLSWAEATRSGRIAVHGRLPLVRAFPSWNGRSVFAHIKPASRIDARLGRRPVV